MQRRPDWSAKGTRARHAGFVGGQLVTGGRPCCPPKPKSSLATLGTVAVAGDYCQKTKNKIQPKVGTETRPKLIFVCASLSCGTRPRPERVGTADCGLGYLAKGPHFISISLHYSCTGDREIQDPS